MNIQPYMFTLTHKFLPFLLAIIGFGILITVHEFGHFIFCKIFGIHTPTFSIGMGPTIFSKKIGDTNFRLAAIPLGGYLEIAGQAEVGQGEQKFARDTSKRSFANRPYWQKAFVILGGIIFNILFAYLILSTLFMVGIPKAKGALIVDSVVKESAAEKYGLEKNDKIISINKKTISSDPDEMFEQMQSVVFKELSDNPDKQITLSVLRDGKIKNIDLILGSKTIGGKNIGSLGAMIGTELTTIEGQYQKYPVFESLKRGAISTYNLIVQMFYGLKMLIKQRSLKGAGGPIMIISKTFETAQKGFSTLLIFLAIISINLAIINLLPIGALDGGQFLFVTIEAIIRRQIPEIIKVVINLASWIFLISLILYLSFKDILTIFNNKYK
ncbi:MAG: M50 family metallopeptidase [bacterium]